MSNLVADITGMSSAARHAQRVAIAQYRQALAAAGLRPISIFRKIDIPGPQKSAWIHPHYKFEQVKLVAGVTPGPLTLPLKTVHGPAPPAPATLPLATGDVPTVSYLEMVEDQAIKQQKALAGRIKSSGFVSEEQAQELAMAAAEEPADLTWVIIVSVLGLVLFGRKLWR